MQTNFMRKKNIVSKLRTLIAVCLLCYPAFSDLYNSHHTSYVIGKYERQASEFSEEQYNETLKEVQEYNESLLHNPTRYQPSEEEMGTYLSLLDLSGDGVMGSISIPSINVHLPVYHTTDDDVLQVAVGHVPGTSLPVDGESTHVVLSGHRGMASAALFTDLPSLKEGDIFQVSALRRILTYEVDQITTVLPQEMQDIQIEEGKEYCTLVTCTPLGVNDHRLLVRGHKIRSEEVAEGNGLIGSGSGFHIQLSTYEIVLAGIGAALFLMEFVISPAIKKIKRKRKEQQ